MLGCKKVSNDSQRRNGHLDGVKSSVLAKMFLHMVCFSLEIKMKLKAKLFKKKKYTVTSPVNDSFKSSEHSTSFTFESFDDIDPWQCCSGLGQDISYSCVLETMHQTPVGDTMTMSASPVGDTRTMSACVGDTHYACSDVTLPVVSSPCCYTYWSLPSHSLLVES